MLVLRNTIEKHFQLFTMPIFNLQYTQILYGIKFWCFASDMAKNIQNSKEVFETNDFFIVGMIMQTCLQETKKNNFSIFKKY